MTDKIDIEVVYALPAEQTLLKKTVPEGTTVLEGIQASGLLEKFPELDVSAHKLGIFGKTTLPPCVRPAGRVIPIWCARR